MDVIESNPGQPDDRQARLIRITKAQSRTVNIYQLNHVFHATVIRQSE